MRHSHLIGPMEFHVAASARDFYQFDLSLFSLSGNVIFADFQAARLFAQKMNARRDLANYPERTVSAAQLNAMGLIDEMLHHVVELYRREQNPAVMRESLLTLETSLGPDAVNEALYSFAQTFPPIRIYRGEIGLNDYFAGSTEGRPNREILLEEMLMLWLANNNPAFAPFIELFDQTPLLKTAYPQIIGILEGFLEEQPTFGSSGLSLFKVLRLPALMHPASLEAQLEMLLSRFGGPLARFWTRMVVGQDVLREEARSFSVPIFFDGPPPGDAGASASVESFNWQQLQTPYEPEAFSPDLDWMPRVVLLAKNAFVWLDQLSRRYGQEIRTLDLVPDAELDMLASWGVSGLWLIGLWERSKASRDIKQKMGNPDAVASAYSLYDYVIASDLGGEAAMDNLRTRAWKRGIRMASDMVPNHMGIDGRWVMQHPDWFLSLPYSPYPGYTFSGPDLSSDPRVGVYLEDHYYDKSDAAVVFKRIDRWTGGEQYIYHGNDGTAMPWNDTAQLNYLNPDVREAVIQTILHVAQQFPIIRFDAAMTLAKRHIQRLWFPPPGGSPWGASIPSRAEHAMTQEAFDAAIPQEFWREVVDRAAVEAPQTLLLAEAFWMMEGYFVRSLGMHRVYNSAFMNMLRDEKNAEYRTIIKNTLEFEPEILKRFVNFLSNPDEKTAVEQFGKGDKYFGAMTLCATLPGLPMLGHGQIEGYTERYGMEYQRAYYDETPDSGLIEHHYSQIFPLLKQRPLFAEVEHFVLYDCHGADDQVNEDVFAYSNRLGSERALVVFHNKNAQTRGWIRTSVGQPVKTGDAREVRQRSLGEGLSLMGDARMFSLFRDSVTGLEYLRHNRELHQQGLYLELGPYERHVFMDWREVLDHRGDYALLAGQLGGRGVRSLEEARRELALGVIHAPFRELVNAQLFHRLIEASSGKLDQALKDEVHQKLLKLYKGIDEYTGGKMVKLAPGKTLDQRLEAMLATGKPDTSTEGWAVALSWLFTHGLGNAQQSRNHLDEWRLGRIVEETMRELGMSESEAQRLTNVVRLLVAEQEALERVPQESNLPTTLEHWSQNPEAHRALGFNRFEGVVYFNREAYQTTLSSMAHLGTALSRARGDKATAVKSTAAAWSKTQGLLNNAAESAGYRVDELLKHFAQPVKSATKPKAKSTEAPVAAKKAVAKTKKAATNPTQTAKPTKAPKPKAPAKPTQTLADDLTLIEGIGPKMAAALKAAGIETFASLSKVKEAKLKEALAASNLRFAPSLPTWAKQAALLAKGDRAGFEAYTKQLKAGREV